MRSQIVQFFFIFCVTTNVYSQVAPAYETDPHRGMFVAGFITRNNPDNGIVNETFSILGVDENRDGVYEKEDALLRYAMENHITYLCFYELERVFDNSLQAFDVNSATMVDLADHLCRFINKARNEYCVTQIGAALGDNQSFNDVIDFNEIFAQPTQPFIFSQEELGSPALDSSLLFVQNAYQPGDSLYLKSEVAKYFLRVAHFNSCVDCYAHIDFVHLSYEFWNDTPPVCDRWNDYIAYLVLMTNNRDMWNAMHPSEPIFNEVYLTYFSPGWNCFPGNPNGLVMAGNVDGSTLYAAPRRADRVNIAYYYQNTPSENNPGFVPPGGFSDILCAFSDPSNEELTDYHPILNAERIGDEGGYDNYCGPFLNSHYSHTIFWAERSLYDSWRNYAGGTGGGNCNVINGYNTNPHMNNIQPGGIMWYSHRQMGYDLERPATLISINNPLCSDNGVDGTFQFQYNGPIEPGISYEFWIDQSGTTVYPCLNCAPVTGLSSNYQPPSITPVQNRVPSIDLGNPSLFPAFTLPVGDYTAHLKLIYNGNQGCAYTYDLPVRITTSPTITAIGLTEFCQGENVSLIASQDASPAAIYTWYRNGQIIDGLANSNELVVTEGGDYYCDILGLLGCNGVTNTISVMVHPNPPVLISAECLGNDDYILHANPNVAAGNSPQNYNWAGATYLWNNGATTDEIQVHQSSGKSYWVIATTPQGCINRGKFRLPTSAAITLSIASSVLPDDNDCATVDIRLSPILSVQNQPVGYLWSNGSTAETIDYPLPGTYYLMCNAGLGGCVDIASFTVSGNSFTPVINATVTPTSCNGASDGAIAIASIAGGVAPYSLQWNYIDEANLGLGNDLVNLHAGYYQLVVIDASCNVAVIDYEITEPLPIEFLLSSMPGTVSCNGLNYTQVVATHSSGGAPPFQYLWSTGATLSSLTNVPAGSYNVTITDLNGCVTTTSIDLAQPEEIHVVSDIVYPCDGLSNGRVRITVCGGTPATSGLPYVVTPSQWQVIAGNPDNNQFELSNLPSGVYTVQITDANGCTRSYTFDVTDLVLSESHQDPACFNGNDGAIDLSVSSASVSNTFLWSPGGATTEDISGLSPGTYVCVVTNSVSNCSSTISVQLQSPAQLGVSLNTVSVSCGIGCNGQINAIAAGGTGAYIYQWINSQLTGVSLNNLCPGPYTCVVTDANGCTASASTVLGSTTASCNGSQVQFCTGATASQVLAAGIYAPGTPVSIESDFTVDVDFTFDNSDVAIATGVRILVDPNARLQVINGTVLHACSVSWQGIELKDGTSSLEILTGSTLRDAVVGVLSSTGSAIAIDQANFLHNERSIFLKTVPFPAFSCQRSTFDYGNISFKDPTAFFHIGLENVNGVQIGITGPGLANDFSHARYCVSANSSDFTLINNNFHDLGYEVKDDVGQYVNIGNAVRAINSPSNQVVIGNSSAPDDHNYFHLIECVGIYVESDLDQLHIRGNEFDKVFRCMDMTGVRNSNVTIYDNKFFSFGLGLLAVEIESSNFTVSENQFNMVSWDPDPTLSVPQPYGLVSRYGTVALSFQNHEQTPVTIHCFNNRMANSRAGIHLRNIDGVNQPNVLVEHNQVFYTHPSYISYGIERGIWLEHDEQVDVRNNHIALRDNVPNPDDAFRLTGIQFDFTTSTRIDENYIGNMGYSTKGSHLCQETRLHCNNFDGYSNGVNAYKLSLPTQGDDDILGSPEFSYNNQWNGVQSGMFKIDGSISSLPILWYFVPGLADDMSNSNFNVVFPISVGFHSACNVPAPNTPIALRDKKYGDLVRGSAVFTIDSLFAHYYALKQFYGEMKKDTDLLSLGTSDDTLYQQTFNQLASGNIGAYYQVMKLVRSGEYLQAEQTLGLIVDSCLPEAYLREVINIILALRWHGDSLSSQQKIILEGIAMDEGIYGGEATYMARAMLKEFFNEEPFAYRSRTRDFYLKDIKKAASGLADKVLLFPNPTRSGLRVQVVQRHFDRLMVYNQIGVLVDRLSLGSAVNQYEMGLTNLSPGMYYLEAGHGEELVGIARFVKLE